MSHEAINAANQIGDDTLTHNTDLAAPIYARHLGAAHAVVQDGDGRERYFSVRHRNPALDITSGVPARIPAGTGR